MKFEKTINKKYYGYDLLHRGSLAFAEIERKGILIDTEYLKKTIKEVEQKIKELKINILQSNEAKEFKKHTGTQLLITSNDHLKTLFFDILGFNPVKQTVTGQASVDEESLSKIDSEIAKKIIKIRKLEKAKNTYLENLLVETSEDGYLHPFFHLHLVRTYRSSSSAINFQNIPKRDKNLMNMIRGAIIPPAGYRILEVDYSGMEVRVAGCYNKDKNFIDYISNPGKDMHRDVSERIFKAKGNISKDVRFIGKNGFTFAQFYGDYYKNCARNMMDLVKEMKPKLTDGTDLIAHMKKKHIWNYEKFEQNVYGVEQWFWGELFYDYKRWKDEFYENYEQNGYVDLYTGFRIYEYMRRNTVINTPIQGSAFHILLLALIFLVGYLIKHKMRSWVFGQIHDSMVLYVHESEFDDIVKIIKYITTKKVREIWDWIIVPLDVEFEVTEVGESWNKKKELEV